MITSRSSGHSCRAIWRFTLARWRQEIGSVTHNTTRFRELVSLNEGYDGFADVLGVTKKDLASLSVALLRRQILYKITIRCTPISWGGTHQQHGMPSRRCPRAPSSEVEQTQIVLAINAPFHTQPRPFVAAVRPRRLRLVSKPSSGQKRIPCLPRADWPNSRRSKSQSP